MPNWRDGADQEFATPAEIVLDQSEGIAQESAAPKNTISTHREGTAQESATPNMAAPTHREGTAQESATPNMAAPTHREGTAQESATPNMEASTHREGTAQESATPNMAAPSHREGTAQESATPNMAAPSHREGTAQNLPTPQVTAPEQLKAPVLKFAKFTMDVPNPHYGEVCELTERELHYLKIHDFNRQRARIYYQPLIPAEAASLALLGRSFVSQEDREKQKLADRYYMKQCRRIARRRPGAKRYSPALKRMLREKKASLMNPFTSDLRGEEGYQVRPEKGSKYRSVGSVYYEGKKGYELWANRIKAAQKLQSRAKAGKVVEEEFEEVEEVVESEEQRRAREAREQLEKKQREAREEEKLQQIRRNMEFLLRDEPIGHFGFTEMHYGPTPAREKNKETDPRIVAMKELQRTLNPGDLQPAHTSAMSLENYNQSLGYQERGLEAEEKALDGVWGIEHMEAGMTDLDLDGMTDEMFQQPTRSEHQEKLDALDRSYYMSLQKSADEMEEGPQCAYCKRYKSPFPHVDPLKCDKHSTTLPNLDYHYYPRPVDYSRYEVGPATEGAPKLQAPLFPGEGSGK